MADSSRLQHTQSLDTSFVEHMKRDFFCRKFHWKFLEPDTEMGSAGSRVLEHLESSIAADTEDGRTVAAGTAAAGGAAAAAESTVAAVHNLDTFVGEGPIWNHQMDSWPYSFLGPIPGFLGGQAHSCGPHGAEIAHSQHSGHFHADHSRNLPVDHGHRGDACFEHFLGDYCDWGSDNSWEAAALPNIPARGGRLAFPSVLGAPERSQFRADSRCYNGP